MNKVLIVSKNIIPHYHSYQIKILLQKTHHEKSLMSEKNY
jgi:hypothetical protein